MEKSREGKRGLRLALAYGGPEEGMEAMGFSPNDRYLLTLGTTRRGTASTLHVVDLMGGGGPLVVASIQTSGKVSAITILPADDDGGLVFATTGTKSLRFWRLYGNGGDQQVITTPALDLASDEDASLTALAPIEDRQDLLLAGGKGGRLWLVKNQDASLRATPTILSSWVVGRGLVDEAIMTLAVKRNMAIVGSSTGITLWDLDLQATEQGQCNAGALRLEMPQLDGAPMAMQWDDHVEDGIIGTDAGTLWYLHLSHGQGE